jgi:D-3-phosphoglycerate dehydrogenase
MKIAVLDDYQNAVRQLDCFAWLDGHEVTVFTDTLRGVAQLAARLHPFDAVVLIRERTAFDRALLAQLPNLKLISQTGKVGAHIDVAAAAELGIAVAEGVGSPTAPAGLTWALIMAAQRKLLPYACNLKRGLWQTVAADERYNTLGSVLSGRTLAIWGYGKIGRLIAGYGRAFGLRVLVWGSAASRAAAADGHGAAALDVFEREPLPDDSPWLRRPNVLATPHLGYVEQDSYELYFQHALQNTADFFTGSRRTLLQAAAGPSGSAALRYQR